MKREAPAFAIARAVLLACGLGGGLTACQRKAPGPEECVAFAFASYGVPVKSGRLTPAFRARVDELTRECLLTPFDRELMECTLAGGSPRACMREFSVRRDGLATSNRRP